MINTNVTNFRKNIYAMLEQTIKYNEPLNISTKNGNAIIMSEAEYKSIVETLYLSSDPKTKKEILDGMAEPVSEGVEYAPNEEW